jgi:undecaprenyl-diphosphatase
MTIFQSILLGIVQGLTEFLPVSSSAHLVIVPYLLGWRLPEEEAFIFNVLVQVATLVGVFAFFWNDLVCIAKAMVHGLRMRQPFGEPLARLGWLIFLGTIPAGLFGLLIKDLIEAAFASVTGTAGFLYITAGLLVVAERVGKRRRNLDRLTWMDSLWIGCFQAIAVFPGVSRSGATMVGGMTRDLERPAAARFSFLLSIPIMLAAGLLAGRDLLQMPSLASYLPVFIPGLIAAGITGYFAIRWLLGYLVHHRLYVFAAYCAALATAVLLLSLTGG